MPESPLIKQIVQLQGVMSRTVAAPLRFEIHVPEELIEQGRRLIGLEDKYFVLIGPFEDEDEIREAVK